jgi:hypothetical protein
VDPRYRAAERKAMSDPALMKLKTQTAELLARAGSMKVLDARKKLGLPRVRQVNWGWFQLMHLEAPLESVEIIAGAIIPEISVEPRPPGMADHNCSVYCRPPSHAHVAYVHPRIQPVGEVREYLEAILTDRWRLSFCFVGPAEMPPASDGYVPWLYTLTPLSDGPI